MGKLLSWIVLGIFLVVVPFISWYYLKQGLDFRKNALMELTPKDSISYNTDSLDIITRKTTLLVLTNGEGISDIIPPILQQFKNTDGFQVLSYDSLPGIQQLPDKYLSDVRSRYSDKSFILIDSALNIRNSYMHDMNSIRKMVEHIAIVIPRVKESDIKMKQ